MLRRYLIALAMLPGLFAALPSHAEPLYNVTRFIDDFTAYDINNHAQMAGATGNPGTSHAALYQNGLIALSTGDTYGRASAINDAGAATGTIDHAGDFRGFLYSNGVMTDLGTRTMGEAINQRGDVAGRIPLPAAGLGASAPAVYRNGQWTGLGNLGIGVEGTAFDINDAGQIVGTSNITDEHANFHAFLYSNGILQDLGTLNGFGYNGAVAINNAGAIAGYSDTEDGVHAFLVQNGVMTDLGSFGGRYLDVGHINASGTFVGAASDPDDTQLGWVFRNGVLVDLNTLIDPAPGWHIDSASAINDLGQIAAHACRAASCGTLLLDPVSAIPEPQGVVMLLAGLALFTATRRSLLHI